MPNTTSNVPLSTDDAGDMVDVSVQKMWLKYYPDMTEYHKEFYYVDKVDDYIVKDSSLSAVDSYGYTPENAIIKAASPIQGFDKSYTQAHFTGKLRITKTMWQFGIKKRNLLEVVDSMKRRAIQIKEQILQKSFLKYVK